jgi:hypothetical protein
MPVNTSPTLSNDCQLGHRPTVDPVHSTRPVIDDLDTEVFQQSIEARLIEAATAAHAHVCSMSADRHRSARVPVGITSGARHDRQWPRLGVISGTRERCFPSVQLVCPFFELAEHPRPSCSSATSHRRRPPPITQGRAGLSQQSGRGASQPELPPPMQL